MHETIVTTNIKICNAFTKIGTVWQAQDVFILSQNPG